MADFDMPATGTWEERGGWVVRRLVIDLSLTLPQAAGFVGNLGFESAGFTKLHEIGQPEGVGGFGWSQWTGARREDFFAFAAAQGWAWQSDRANYGMVLKDLRGDYRHTVAALRLCETIEDAVFSVGQTYERPGGTTETHLPGYDGRLDYARRALAGAQAAPPAPPAPVAVSIPSARELQTALKALGFDPGPIDGIWGPRSAAALAAHLQQKT